MARKIFGRDPGSSWRTFGRRSRVDRDPGGEVSERAVLPVQVVSAALEIILVVAVLRALI
jgi:hypothetical protein